MNNEQDNHEVRREKQILTNLLWMTDCDHHQSYWIRKKWGNKNG